MHKSITVLLTAGLITAGTAFYGCDGKSPAAKMEKAQKDRAAAANDSAAAVIAAANEAEWEQYKAAAAVKIKAHEKMLAEINLARKQAGRNLEAGYVKTMDSLKALNDELMRRIEAYGKPRNDWESFQREFGRDMDALGQALKDLTVKNK